MSNDEHEPTNGPVNATHFLLQLLGELDAKIGAIWVGGSGQLLPVYAQGLDESGLFDGEDGKRLLAQVLSDTLNQGHAQTYDTEGMIEPKAFGHATLFVAPLLIPNARPGVILVVERPNLPQQQRLGVVRHIDLRCRELARQIAMMAQPTQGSGPELTSQPMPQPVVVPQPAFAPTFTPAPQPTFAPMAPPMMTAAGPQMAAPQMASAQMASAQMAAPQMSASQMAAPQISMQHPAAPQMASMQAPAAMRQVVDPRTVFDYLLALQRSLDLNEVANVAVNDGRVLLAADRVSLAMSRGKNAVIKAVSGQESVHPRGNLIRAMRRLTQKVINAGEPFRYDGSLGNVPQQLEEPLAEFIQEAGARFLLIVPLLEPERLVKPEEPMGGGKVKPVERKPIGALIIEQMSSSEPSAQMKSTLDSVIDHIAAAAYNSKSHSTIFLLPVWRSTGRFFEWLRGRRLAIAAAIVMVITIATVAMVVVPWDYRVDGKGKLMPIIQREVFAPEDGQVIDVLFDEDKPVEKDTPLVRLRNDELEAEMVKVRNELQEKTELLNSLKAQFEEADSVRKADEALKVQGKLVETEIEVKGATEQYKILKDRRERLTVRAPMAGRVTTFQVQQLLLNRPVKRGDLLLEVMDETGPWQLELEIAEHRVGRILKAQAALKKSNLDIEYRLLTSPEKSFQATLNMLATRTVTVETDGSVLEARATLDTNKELPSRAIGAEVRARIGCGKSCLGDVLFGDIIEFAMKYLWW